MQNFGKNNFIRDDMVTCWLPFTLGNFDILTEELTSLLGNLCWKKVGVGQRSVEATNDVTNSFPCILKSDIIRPLVRNFKS